MCKFIRLTNVIINVSKISKIDIKKEAFVIHMNGFRHDGFMFLGCGGLDTYREILEVSKEKNHCDYIKFIDYLDKISL